MTHVEGWARIYVCFDTEDYPRENHTGDMLRKELLSRIEDDDSWHYDVDLTGVEIEEAE